MPMFMSEEDFRQCSGDTGTVAEKADAYIRQLLGQIETFRAEAGGTSITLEQKYVSLSADYSSIQSHQAELNSELGQLQSEKQQLMLQSIEKDREIERLRKEAFEVHNSKRQLMEQKDLELTEKNATIKSYFNKIACLKKQERDYAVAQKEVIDLQKQVAFLLKECQDVQLRCGFVALYNDDDLATGPTLPLHAEPSYENIISERLMEVNIRGKDAELEEVQKLVLEKENTISNLEKLLSERQDASSLFERDLAGIRIELIDRESRITEIYKNETSLKSELDKARGSNINIRRSSNKKNAKLGKEVQALSKQLEDAKQTKQSTVKEMESRMQILERTIERLREDLKTRITIMDARGRVIQRQANLTDELSKHNQALRALQDEVNKLRNDQSEGTQNISSTILEDFASAYNQAVENFKQTAQQFCGELDSANTDAAKEPQGDTDMSNVDELNTAQITETRGNDTSQITTASGHKRPSTLSHSDLPEEALAPEETAVDVPVPLLKKSKPSETEQEGNEEPPKHTEVEESMAKYVVPYIEAKRIESEEEQKVDEQIQGDTGDVNLEDELAKSRSDIISLRSEREKLALEVQFAQKKLARFMKKFDHQLEEQQRINELMEKYKDFDIGDYNRLKESCHEMEVNIRGKDAELEEVQKLVLEKENTIWNLEKLLSERQDASCLLERDLAGIVVELSDKESRITEISKNETSLKSELDKARRSYFQIRRSSNKEKEKLGKEVQALSKQLEGAKEAVKEKEGRMQILERTLESLREDLKRERENCCKEKEKTAKTRIIIMDARGHVIQRQAYLTDELSKHNQALRSLQDEVNKLRNNQSEGTQNISSTILEDFASAYNQAVENFKQTAQQFCCESDSTNTDAVDPDNNNNAPSAEAPIVQTPVPPTVSNVPTPRTNEEKEERQSPMKKRKRKLVLPSIMKPKVPQGDTDMSKVDELNTAKILETQGNDTSQITTGSARKSLCFAHVKDIFDIAEQGSKEFQDLRIESENLERLLREKDSELESYRREIDALKVEKAYLEKRIDELMEKYKDFDIDDYNRLKVSCHQMEVNIRGKDAELEEVQKLLSEGQDASSVLERDLARIRIELSNKESRITEILKNETSLKSELDKARRSYFQIRRSSNKEKEKLGKEVQALSKQLEDAKQLKNSAMEQAVKEKESQRQILERTLVNINIRSSNKEKEELGKEVQALSNQLWMLMGVSFSDGQLWITILDDRGRVIQRGANLSDELSKHNQALRVLQDEVNQLRNDQSEGTQNISSTILEDFASAYNQALENFKQKAQQFCGEPDSTNTDAADPDNNNNPPSAEASIVQTPVQPTVSNVPIPGTNEEKEKGQPLMKKRKIKLVRRRIMKPKQPQGNADMSKVDELNTTQITETQGNDASQITTGSGCKRPLTLSHSDLPEEVLAPEETTADVPMPLLKKSKPSETEQEVNEEPPRLTEVEESMAKDVVPYIKAERYELEEEQKVDEQIQGDENLDKPREIVSSDDQLRDQTEDYINRIDASDKLKGTKGDQLADTDQVPESSSNAAAGINEDVASSTQGGPSLSSGNKTSTIINLTERARLRSQIRLAGIDRSVGGSTSRSRGRVVRGRGVRGGHTGRGPDSQAVENFKQTAQQFCGEPDSTKTDAADPDNSNQIPPTAEAPIVQTPVPLTVSNVPNEEKEKRQSVAKANVKLGRKLVRPSITKLKEPQGDADNTTQITENQGYDTSQITTGSGRKCPSTLPHSDLPEETTVDVLHKKSKPSEAKQEGNEEPPKLTEVEESMTKDVVPYFEAERDEAKRNESEEVQKVDEQIQADTGDIPVDEAVAMIEDVASSTQGGPALSQEGVGMPVSPRNNTSTNIDLTERARLWSQMDHSFGGSPSRGRGSVVHGRGVQPSYGPIVWWFVPGPGPFFRGSL